VIVPTETEIQGEIVAELPIVLPKDRVIIVAQMDLVSRGSETAGTRLGKKARIDRTEGGEVTHCRKELQVQNLRLNSIDMSTQKVPTELNAVFAEELRNVGGKRRVLLIEK